MNKCRVYTVYISVYKLYSESGESIIVVDSIGAGYGRGDLL